MQTRPPRRNPSAAALHPHPTGLVGTSPELPGEVRNVTYVRQASNTDIALAQLSAPVTAVSPLGLSKTRPATGSLLTIAGWGATSSTNPSPATELSTGVVKISAISSTTINVVGYAPAADTSLPVRLRGALLQHRTGLPAHQPGNHRTSRHHRKMDQNRRARPALMPLAPAVTPVDVPFGDVV